MSKSPPVPPAGRSDKDAGAEHKTSDRSPGRHRPQEGDPSDQGHQANIRQNTRNQGHQQSR